MSTGDIAEMIDLAGCGLVSWDAVNATICNAFPGSFSAIASHGRRSGKANFVSIAGMAEKSMDDYFAYYSTVNPWNPYWARMKSGDIMRSELDCPTSLFSKTEFINDWLLPIQKSSVGMGLKLDSNSEDDLFLSIHLPGNLADRLSPQVVLLLQQQSSNLDRAIAMNRFLSDHIGKSVAAAALIERGSNIAFVVDHNLRIVEANKAAVGSFSEGQPVKAIGNIAYFSDGKLQRWFSDNARGLSIGGANCSTSYLSAESDHAWQVRLARVREHDPRVGNYFLPSRRLILVLVNDVREERSTRNLNNLRAFGLTPAEIRMCEMLVLGYPLKQAAEGLGITFETARDRLKSIFQKTGTNRQSALATLLGKIT